MPLVTVSTIFSRPLLYAMFVGTLEFAGLSAALWWFLAGRPGELARAASGCLLALATAVLLGLPLLRYGYANDLVMRGGMPALFVLQVLLVRNVRGCRGRPVGGGRRSGWRRRC